MSRILLGLVGKKRTGKDTLAQRLVEEHGFVRVAFADPLKRAAIDLDPLIERSVRLSNAVDFHGYDEAKEAYSEVRRTLQNLGVAIRNLDPEFWVRMGMEEAAKHERAVITDVRFPNEAKAVELAGGVTVKILRDTGLTDQHISETALDDFNANWTINNEGSIEDLHNVADRLVEFTSNWMKEAVSL